jgi:hypothetical protein
VSRLTPALLLASVLAATVLFAGPPARTAPAADVLPAQPTSGPWSAPAAVSDCAAAPAARVVFPSDSPSHATGRGALVWSAAAGCPGGAGVRVSRIAHGDVPGAAAIPRSAAGRPLTLHGPLVAAGAPHGQIVIGGSASRSSTAGLLIQGAAEGPFAPLIPAHGSAAPMALTTAYLGDVALASPPAGTARSGAVQVHVERFFSHRFVRDASASAPAAGSPRALTLAMDYRSDALAVWVQDGAIYARDLPGSGRSHPIQRLARALATPTITALLSDDNRAIVAWAEQRGSETSVYIDRSATGVRFGTPQLLERFRDPDGLPSPAASPMLIRLSSESVMLAWAGAADGRWVVRTAPVDLNGVRSTSTISPPDVDALLSGLAPGPNGEALALWTEPLPTAAGPPDVRRQAIFAARGIDALPGRTIFGRPEEVAPPGPVRDASVALDPSSGRAVVAWQGERASIDYAIRSAVPSP